LFFVSAHLVKNQTSLATFELFLDFRRIEANDVKAGGSGCECGVGATKGPIPGTGCEERETEVMCDATRVEDEGSTNDGGTFSVSERRDRFEAVGLLSACAADRFRETARVQSGVLSKEGPSGT